MAKGNSKLGSGSNNSMAILREYADGSVTMHYGLAKTLSSKYREEVIMEFGGYGDATKGTYKDFFGNKLGTSGFKRRDAFLGASDYNKTTKTMRVNMTPEDVQGAIANYNIDVAKTWGTMYDRKSKYGITDRAYKYLTSNIETMKKSAEMKKHYDTYRTAIYNIARSEWSKKSGKNVYVYSSIDIKKYKKDYATSKSWINKNKFSTDTTKYVNTQDFKFIK